jgi:hypothetical protein
MFDIKTEVIVNGSWRASCDMCFQGIDEDISSVRVLLFYCLWESTGHVHIHLLTLDLFFVVQVLVIVNCCMLLIYMHRQTFTTYSFSLSLLLFFQFNWWRRNWVRYLCVRQSIVHILARFFKCSYGRQCDKKNEKKQTLIMISFHCHYIYTMGRGEKKLLVSQKRKIDSWE